jgi:hypothetical protein
MKKKFLQMIKAYILRLLVSQIPAKKCDSEKIDVGISALLSHANVDRFICAAASCFYFLGMNLPIFIIDDGTLTSNDITRISNLFTVTFDRSSSKKMQRLIKEFKYFSKYRFNSETPYNNKKFDALLLQNFKKTIYLDDSILFFSKPHEILNFIETSSRTILYNSRPKNSHLEFPFLLQNELHSIRKLLYELVHSNSIDSANLSTYFNSGLLCIPSQRVISLKELDKIFKVFEEIYFEKDLLAEEIALFLLFDHSIARSLPTKKYCVVSEWGEYCSINFSQVVAIHYTSGEAVKNRNISDAIKLLLKCNFFKMI